MDIYGWMLSRSKIKLFEFGSIYNNTLTLFINSSILFWRDYFCLNLHEPVTDPKWGCPSDKIFIALSFKNADAYYFRSFFSISYNSDLSKCRSSRPEVFCKKCVLRNFRKFTGKHLCQSLVSFLIKLQVWGLKNTFFTKHLRWLLL